MRERRNEVVERKTEKKASLEERIAELEAKLKEGDETVQKKLNSLNAAKKFKEMLMKKKED